MFNSDNFTLKINKLLKNASVVNTGAFLFYIYFNQQNP